MTFLADLRDGTHGIRVALPSSMRVERDIEREALLQDDSHSVTWHLALGWAMVDLRKDYVALLRSDLAREARWAFEDTLRSRHAEAGVPQGTPRTSDTEWSPLVSVEDATVSGADALIVIHRLAYEPGEETVAGRVLIPLEKGTVHLSALSRVTLTGFRETLLSQRMLDTHFHAPEHPPLHRAMPEVEAQAKLLRILPSQTQIDDPAFDVAVPKHPLSLVRAALRWLLGGGLRIEVTQPLRNRPRSSVELPTVGCDMTPPPRFVFAPMMAERMSQTLAPFTRACLPGVQPQLFDVWRVPDAQIRGVGHRWRLKRLATKTIRGWASEGATDIHVETWPLPPLGGRPRLGSYVRFRTVAGPTHSLACWIADLDGTVFRLAAGGPLGISKDELMHRIETAASTWRRRTP
jgi:hypothetical protein